MNENERQFEHVVPKLFVGKAEPISGLEMEFVMSQLLEMTNEEMKGILTGLAN